MTKRARYAVGIDLGTTNSALAYVDTEHGGVRIESLPIAQLVDLGQVADRPSLPSFLYIAGEHDVRPGDLRVPWSDDESFAVGELAREQGARVSGRLVSSAKSWLCHGGVDREAPILPWGAPDDVRKISPIDASRRYLEHLCGAWSRRFPRHPLPEQDVVLTIPASFDEVARELTVRAATAAGLHHVTLLEEPQAAFYAWVQRDEESWEAQLRGRSLALVIDVGGGTTDFSLIRIRPDGAHVALDRLAVGDHILLGGDNIDVALARRIEERLGERLDSQRWHQLTNLCRAAKETLLGEDPPETLPIRLAGRGRAVIGGTLSATLTRQEVLDLVLDGFFPPVEADAQPRRTARAGLQEWGLPFAAEAELTRHLAAFLRQHAADPVPGSDAPLGTPDVLLFNGGALKPPVIRQCLAAQLARWSGAAPLVLESAGLDLAVSRGAAYYGLVRRGLGVRIGGGSPRAFYVGLAGADTPTDQVEALCVVHRGMLEGAETEIDHPHFEVIANRPVSFPLYASSTRSGDAAGAVARLRRDELSELPPIRTVLRFGRKLNQTTLPVHVVSALTELGMLELWLRSLRTDHRWRLQFKLREQGSAPAAADADEPDGGELSLSPERLAAAIAALGAVFPVEGPGSGDPVALTRQLEVACGAGKDAWPLDAIRALWEALFAGRAARQTTPAHEARWLNLCGFTLRPGFGHENDAWRIQQLWRLYSEGLTFPRAVQGRVEWWNLWKRIAGGLSRPQQTELFNQVAPHLLPRLRSRRKDKSAVGPQEIREYWQLVASCEQLAAGTKAELGAVLVDSVCKGKASSAECWALGRLGARSPFHGPLNQVVARATVEAWVEALLGCAWKKPDSVLFALVQLARCVDDRERDLDADLRRRLAEKLRPLPHGERAARLVREHVPLEARERARILDETLPAGLRLISE
jgi:molecular chaperone DnaK (HSP70)